MDGNHIHIQIEGDIPTEYIRGRMNLRTVLYAQRSLGRKGLSRETQLELLDTIIENVKSYFADAAGTEHDPGIGKGGRGC